MISTIKKFGYLVLATTLLFSCDNDDEDMEEHECPPETTEELHECYPYTPQSFSDALTDSWSEANEEDIHPSFITIPESEYGGGVVTVTLELSDGGAPSMSVWESEMVNQGGSIFTSGNPDGNTFTAKFTAYPGKSYTAVVYPFFNPSSFPAQYTLTWSYEGKMDCYEHNDNRDQAKYIPKNLDIEASILAGHIENGIGSLDEHTYDWYKFVLEEDAHIEALLDECPEDIKMTIRFFDEDGLHRFSEATYITGSGTTTGSTFTQKTTSVQPAGTYWVEVKSFFAPEGDVVQDEPEPDHWNTNYNFRVYPVN